MVPMVAMVACFWLALPMVGAATTTLRFAEVLGDFVVLQQEPAKAAIFGEVNDSSVKSVSVSLKSADGKVVTKAEALVLGGYWKALLPPQKAGGDWSITAIGGKYTSVLKHVTFGDVWYCSGQSNMALQLHYTMSRNVSLDAIKDGKYNNIRIHGMSSNMNPSQPWQKVSDAIESPGTCDKGCNFFKFSSTCWYFAESLVDRLNDDTPIGLIHTAWGGSMIEAWLDNKTIASCQNATLTSGNQKYHDQRVLPYVNMSLKGWIWYQGENDMHGTHGNSALNYGYGCLMQRLVSSWRSMWSLEAETTDHLAPFGFVTLAASGGEGGRSMGAMRWAQTANYGVAPNPAMPRTFLAQAFDLDDPFSNITCYRKGCCGAPKPGCESCLGPDGYCESLQATNYYMGPIHPRDKKPVGDRLAQAAVNIAYGKAQGAFTGPTLFGCHVANGKIIVQFNRSLLASDQLIVKDYRSLGSRMEVLTNKSLFCLQTSGRQDTECIDDGSGHASGYGAFEDAKTWVSVDVQQESSTSLTVDLSKTQGVAFGLRYAWKGDCCDERPPSGAPCPIASCPLMARQSKLPVNPFIARIVNGKCQCVAPQQCEESLSEMIVSV